MHKNNRFLLVLRSLLFWLVFAISTIAFALFSVFLRILPEDRRYPLITNWNQLNIWALKVICGLDYQVEGKENLPSGAAIALAKHQSTWETIALAFILPPQVWVLKQSLLRIPFFGWGLTILKPIAIDRGAGANALEQVVTQGRERLDSGLWVVIYPEGTRSMAGKKKRYKRGGSVLAAETGYPVVPVAHNAGYFWPKNQFIKRPGTITVRIGPTINTKGLNATEINALAEDWIEGQMLELNAQGARQTVERRLSAKI
jgi:1-acyl-sn-glycerol-3-phosphate acyltransferase